MTRPDPDADLDVTKQILRYFERNPQAADTVEGVARWRLLEQSIQSNLETVMRAMAFLVSKGFLVKESRLASPAVFRLNTKHIEQIQQFLAKGKETPQNAKYKAKEP